jgi:ferredoxin-nitrite reductase
MSQSKNETFSESQKQYLCGLAYGTDVARAIAKLPVLSNSANPGTTIQVGGPKSAMYSGPDRASLEAQDATLAAGKKLCKEEQAKRDRNGLDIWDDIQARASAGEYPQGTDVFLTKYHGMFYVAPAQDSFMCRMRIPGGLVRGWQLRGIAAVASDLAGGYIDVTTRANLQLREIAASSPTEVLLRLRELDITCQGSGADNIRNCTASPLSGVDPDELIETIPLAKRMHYYILANRDLYGLPRKFNIAFESGGLVSSLDDTNDIGFRAVQVTEAQATEATPAGVFFLLALGGITGHRDFARGCGILLTADECIHVAAAIVRVFIQHGDRTDRRKARLKYVIDSMGLEQFCAKVEKQLGRKLRRTPNDGFTRIDNEDRLAHVGIHPQKQPGYHYVGVVLPVGRLTSEQAIGLANLADRFGNGELRLTVWQNVIIPSIRTEDLPTVEKTILALGLDYRASSFRAGLVACTGNAGCKYAGADTKGHAMLLAGYLESLYELDSPINIHLTGCHHSCAQHYIGDIGMQACSVEQGDDTVEGYHIHVGGGWGRNQAIGRLLLESIAFDDCPRILGNLIGGFLSNRVDSESFASFAARHTETELRELATSKPVSIPTLKKPVELTSKNSLSASSR